VAQAPSHDGDASEKNHGLYPGMKFTTSLVWPYWSMSRSWSDMRTLRLSFSWSAGVEPFKDETFWVRVSREDIWDMSRSRPWDVYMIFCMKEKNVLEWVRRSSVSNKHWPDLSIVGHVQALFSLPETYLSFLEGRNLEFLIAIHIGEFHRNFLNFEPFDRRKEDDCSWRHLIFYAFCLPKMKPQILLDRTNR
jgi:hypothetical protein